MLEIISIEQTEKWDEAVRSMCAYDFYHLSAYHRLDPVGKPVLLYSQVGNTAFALPVIIRNIGKNDYNDITSVYGYAGPLSNSLHPNPQETAVFQQELKTYFDEQQIVSVFARLHPLLEQQNLLNGLGENIDTNLTVVIDLNCSETEQKKQYSRSLRTQLNRLKKSGIEIIQSVEKEDIDQFYSIYVETMDRVQALPYYYFSIDYFYRFISEIDSALFLAKKNQEIISGSLCPFTNGIMQAHLNATKNDYLSYSPLKLVLDTARAEGMKRKQNILHLGGGKSGYNNSLFEFKSRFSHQYFQFCIWEYIHNPVVYKELSQTKEQSFVDFFPAYR